MIFTDEYEFLSNFYKAPIEYTHNGYTYHYSCSEALYQAFKTGSKFGLYEYQGYDGGQAKRMSHKNIIVSNWEDVKLDRMKLCLKLKFEQNPKLIYQLTSIKEDIVETNRWHDNYWGDCICKKCKNKEGLNYLGKLLMSLKEEYLYDENK